MADAWQTYPIEFRGGLITNLSPLQQGLNAPGTATVLLNFEPSVEGGYRRILGFQKFDSAALSNTGFVRGLFRYDNQVYAVRGDGLFRSTGSGWTEITDNATFSSTGITIGGSGKVRFAAYDFDGTDKFMLVDDTGKPFTFDNSTFKQLTALSADFTGCSHVTIFKNHIFLANGNNLLFSAPYQDEDFSVANGGGIINVGDLITDIIVFRDQLIIFTQTKIKRLAGNSVSDFQLITVSEDLGAVEFDTAQEIGGDVMFLGPDGLRLLSATDRIGDFGLAVVSKKIQSEATNFINNSNSYASLVIREKSQYRIFGFNSGFTDDAALGLLGTQFAEQGGQDMAWSELRGINAYVAYSTYEDAREYAFFANDDGYVYELENGNSFDGSNIVASFSTPYLSFQDPRVRKTFYKMFLYTDPKGSVSFDVSLKLDFDRQNTGLIQPAPITLSNSVDDIFLFDDPSSLYGTATFSSGDLETQFETQLIGSGFTAAIQVDCDNINPPFTLDAVTLEYAMNGRR